jgi:cytochrome c oxidase cbb3-type subunit 2
MSFRTFLTGLIASFGAAWLAVVVIPFFTMRSLAPVPLDEPEGTSTVFQAKRAGRVADGAAVYAANGCYECHTQLVRPTYAGNDMFRADWGGRDKDPDLGDTRRETNAFDFEGERYAQVGNTRMGPDLSNLAHRVEALHGAGSGAERWLFTHLYNPRLDPTRWDSMCPPHRFLFKTIDVKGAHAADALCVETAPGRQVVPGAEARALVSYLLSLKKDQPVPSSLDFSAKKK